MIAIYYGISNQELAEMINQDRNGNKTIEIVPGADKNATNYTIQPFNFISLDLYHNMILSDDTNTYRVVINGKVESVEHNRHTNRYNISVCNDDNMYIVRCN